jgi:hypothetical protein
MVPRMSAGAARRPASAKVHLRATATVEKQLEKAEALLRLTEDYLVPTEEYLMQAEAYLRSTREHLEAAETQLAPAGAPLISTSKTVAGVLWRMRTSPQRGQGVAVPAAQQRRSSAGGCCQALGGRGEQADQPGGASARRDRGCPGRVAAHHPGAGRGGRSTSAT